MVACMLKFAARHSPVALLERLQLLHRYKRWMSNNTLLGTLFRTPHRVADLRKEIC